MAPNIKTTIASRTRRITFADIRSSSPSSGSFSFPHARSIFSGNWYRKDGDARGTDDSLRGRPNQCTFDHAFALQIHDNEIHLVLIGDTQYFTIRIAFGHHGTHLNTVTPLWRY